LLATRQVCHGWNNVAVKSLKPMIGPVTFGENYIQLRDFVELMRKTPNVVFTKYDFLVDSFIPDNQALLEEFFAICGNSMETLKIWLDEGSTMVFDSDYLIRTSFPRLKSLIFLDIRRMPEDGKTFHSYGRHNFFRALFSASATLEKLVFHFADTKAESDYAMESFLQVFTESKSLQSLKHLELDVEVTNDQLKRLSSLEDLRLTVLCVNFGSSRLSQTAMYDLLQSQQATLETFKITDYYKVSDFAVKFPYMENLKCLQLYAWENSGNRLPISKFEYNETFPCLEKILLRGWGRRSDWNVFFPRNFSNKSVTHLQLPYKFDDTSLVTTLPNFTNLTCLEVTYSTKSHLVITHIFGYLTNLRQLVLNVSILLFPENLDSLLTGFSNVECSTLLQEFEKTQTFQNIPERTNPSIVDMKSNHDR